MIAAGDYRQRVRFMLRLMGEGWAARFVLRDGVYLIAVYKAD